MITINSFLHREELNDIILRWMYDQARPSDSELIVRLVHFNRVYVSRYLEKFAGLVFRELHPGELLSRPVKLKGELKDVIVEQALSHSARSEELIRNYRQNPGRYYRETPFHGTLYFRRRNGLLEYVGSSRIKRVRRLAEKTARRIIDRIFTSIKMHADTLAYERARRLNIPLEQLFTTPEDMTEEFLRAENRLLNDLRERRFIAGAQEGPAINDVAGVKVILEEAEQRKLKELFERLPNCEVLEEERHIGRYNAVNLLVCFRPPREEILARPLGRKILEVMQARGFAPEDAERSFAEFVRSGEEDVLLEIILSTYQEMLESEIGCCIHEDRIIEQRLFQQYRGPLARNIQYLTEYLFIFPASERKEFGELPIKLWNRYLPDYFDEILKNLFGIPPDNFLD
ncbi:MAG: hypothetical protein A2Z43_06215 [Syntrophobacterales bacterium RBG_19FT_COMBO_59_10]|nr:MAG: hypothetical protein A2Z43_06215 [Syntrophobacterales bacterium RBG_19FT_COMBO_59_10]